MKAAAHTYFNKNLKDLTLAQEAVLAAIPQSPTAYDLVRNAEEVCATPNVEPGRLRSEEAQPRRPEHDPRSTSGATTSST